MKNTDKSKSLAGLIGPVLMVMVLAELKLWNPTLYDEQIVPLIYLSGVLMFIAGLSIIRIHNIWIFKWPILITLIGWAGMVLGIARMFFPQAYQGNFKNDRSALIVEFILILIGLILSIISYWPGIKNDN